MTTLSSSTLPFYIVTLSHSTWTDALQCARILPPESMPELRLDLFPDMNGAEAVKALGRSCLVTCRRKNDGGHFEGTESERMARLISCLEARPAWMDLEWDMDIPKEILEASGHMRLLRSVHVEPGCFDLAKRLEDLPKGDAYKWVGVASQLSDNARLVDSLNYARNHQIPLSAFLMGKKGEASRCLQGIWGGSFTYAAPDDAPANTVSLATGQLPIGYMKSLRAHKLHKDFGICAVVGAPLDHSPSPAFHNAVFQRSFKDLVYIRMESGDALEVKEALEALHIRAISVTSPLKESLPALLGMKGPLNTLWEEEGQWRGMNTDLSALQTLMPLQGPVLILGDGGVAETTRLYLESKDVPILQASRKKPLDPSEILRCKPQGVVQATRLGMKEVDGLPFPELLNIAQPSLRWALEWISRPDTAFSGWAKGAGLSVVDGASLFKIQAQEQSKRFLGL